MWVKPNCFWIKSSANWRIVLLLQSQSHCTLAPLAIQDDVDHGNEDEDDDDGDDGDNTHQRILAQLKIWKERARNGGN